MKHFSLEIDEQEHRFAVCSQYAELKPRAQLLLLNLAYCQPKTLEARVQVLRLCCTMPDELLQHLCQMEFQGELQRLLELVEWAWTSGIETRPVPKFRVRATYFLLPDEQLRQVGTGEFITAIAYLVAFTQQGGTAAEKQQMLDCFLASICRPERSVMQRLSKGKSDNGDHRVPFNSFQVETRARAFESMPMPLKVAIMQWFLRATEKMERLYGMPAPDPEEAQTGINLGTFVRDWETTVHELATAGSFGNYDQVMDRPIHDVMGWLEIRKIESDRQRQAPKTQIV